MLVCLVVCSRVKFTCYLVYLVPRHGLTAKFARDRERLAQTAPSHHPQLIPGVVVSFCLSLQLGRRRLRSRFGRSQTPHHRAGVRGKPETAPSDRVARDSRRISLRLG